MRAWSPACRRSVQPAVRPQQRDRPQGHRPAPLERGARRGRLPVDAPAAVRALPGLQALEVALDGVRRQQLAQRAARAGREVEGAQALVLQPALHRQLAGRRHAGGEALELGPGAGVGVDERVEQAEREAQLVGAEAIAAVGDLPPAEVRRAGQPGVRRHARVVRGDGLPGRDDRGGDVERRARGVGAGPPRRGARRGGAGDREREAAVVQARGREPVAERGSQVAGRRRGLLQHLEGVEGAGRLAGGRAQVGLERPAEAAVVVAVGAQRVERPGGRGPVEQEGEAPAVEHARVGVHEGAGCGEIDHARQHPRRPPPRLERIGRYGVPAGRRGRGPPKAASRPSAM